MPSPAQVREDGECWRSTQEWSDTEPKKDSDSETEGPCNQERSDGETEECSDTEPERDSDSTTGEPSNNVDWEDVEIECEDGEEPIIIKDDEAPVFGTIMLQLSLKQGLREWVMGQRRAPSRK